MPDVGGGNPILTVAELWNAARNTPDSNSTTDAQIRAARDAGYTGTRAQLIAIGQSIVSADAFNAQQGGSPGPNRPAPVFVRPITNTPPLVPPITNTPPPEYIPPTAAPDFPWLTTTTFYTGPRNPRRTPKRKKQETWNHERAVREARECALHLKSPTDDNIARCYTSRGLDAPEMFDDAFVRSPGFEIPTAVLASRIGVLSRVLNPMLGFFWPSSTSSTDAVSQAEAEAQARKNADPRTPTRGPTTRPNIRTPVRPAPGPTYWPSPRVPDRRPAPRDAPIPRILRDPFPMPQFDPRSVPAPAPIPAPRPTPAPPGSSPTWFDPLYLVPLLSQPGRTPGRFQFPQTPTSPNPNPAQFEQPFASPMPQPNDRCDCTKTKQRKKKDSCSNPIVSKRKRTKDGQLYLTITRRIECQALSKKKLPSLPAR